MKKLVNDRTKFLIVSSLVISLIITIVIELLSYNSNKQLSNNNNELFRYYRILEIQHDLLINVFTLENNGHRFLLTGDKKFLQNSDRVEAEIRNSEKLISNYFKEDTGSLRVVDLIQILEAKTGYFNEVIDICKSEGFNSALKIIEDEKGRTLTKEFISFSNKIDHNTHQKIEILRRSNNELSERTNFWDITSTVVDIILLFIFMFFLFKDVNQRSQLEIDLRKEKIKAEQSVILKEQFMANMSHEIRTPMTSIIGFTNLLERTNLDDKQKDYIHTVKNSSESLLTIINDILDFSKLEAGMIRFEETIFSMQSLLHSVNTMFLPKIKEKNILLIFHPIESIPEILLGDPVRLTQIMINLIGNAVKFTNEGVIEVSAKLLTEDEQIATVQFTVSDNGIGIPKDKIGIVFDRFQQADAETNRRFGGTGLGLSIVKNLVECQGGVISVDSDEGKGSLFSFTIPYKKVPKEIPKQILTEEKNIQKDIMNKVRILIAEDNPLNRKLIDAMFSEWGIEFEFAENGKVAIEKLSSDHFGLVLMDIQMSEINGYEATKFIRENLKSEIPIIAMTAHALAGEREKCIAFGMNDYISKPIKESELYSLIVKYAGALSKNEKAEFSPVANAEEEVTNLEFLTSLANGKEKFFNEMIQLFLEECPIELSRLHESIEEKNFQMIHANAHAMKSTIPFVGLDTKLNPLLEEMEDSSDLAKINQLFLVVESVCSKAITELKNYQP